MNDKTKSNVKFRKNWCKGLREGILPPEKDEMLGAF